MERSEVYVAIDSEREFQDRLWTEHESYSLNTVAAYVAYMRQCVNQAWFSYASCTEVFRKIAALAVCCLEQHGIVRRGSSDVERAPLAAAAGEDHLLGQTMREYIYSIIDAERDYQDQLSVERNWDEAERVPPGKSGNADVTRAEFLVLLDVYTRRAEEAWTDRCGPKPTLDIVRKIAAIAVHCMEIVGTPYRDLEE